MILQYYLPVEFLQNFRSTHGFPQTNSVNLTQPFGQPFSENVYKGVIFVCLFVVLIITQEPLTNLPQILTGEFGRTTAMFFS